ncbi:MAG: glycoside hydrolase family 88 protein [Tannerella sp.]|jgi:unsaturated chondroitin disaccharide hydrolase|nr:glycoside hydrolase family 88 protein [Tannerella sp.]
MESRGKIKTIQIQAILISLLIFTGCRPPENDIADSNLDYCVLQAKKTVQLTPDYTHLPNNVNSGETEWHFSRPGSWTCGFWPGILWYIYEYTKDDYWKKEAENFTNPIIPRATGHARSHDVGFMTYCSIGNGYRLTGNPEYRHALLQAADSLSALFNPSVGTFLSWPNMVKRMDWPHNTIIDNMMNLELLFWAAKNGGDKRLYEIARKHAETTMNCHFRADYSAYHVIVYDDRTGAYIKGVTHQGYADETMWARGQAWAIYGFTMSYRETKDNRFLETAQKAADLYLRRLPEDMIPYWDFDAPAIPAEPRDASAAAIAASALLELSTRGSDKEKSEYYRISAEKILKALSSPEYQSRDANTSFLLHSTGHWPNGSEIDASIIYADYYYLEALIRLKKLKSGVSQAEIFN